MTTLEVRPLTPERMDAYLQFFDKKAFTDNPRWAHCYCYFPYHDPAKIHWPERAADENRAAIRACIRNATAMGFLAYTGDEVVGWCNAGPRGLYPMLRDAPAPEEPRTGTIFCFIVAAAFRGKGVARALLDAACVGLAAQGLKVVEARPVKHANTAAANHLGPLSMYIAAGFSIVREDDEEVYVQKRLG